MALPAVKFRARSDRTFPAARSTTAARPNTSTPFGPAPPPDITTTARFPSGDSATPLGLNGNSIEGRSAWGATSALTTAVKNSVVDNAIAMSRSFVQCRMHHLRLSTRLGRGCWRFEQLAQQLVLRFQLGDAAL